MKLKVYCLRGDGSYCVGMALVVAENEDKAKILAHRNPKRSSTWDIDYFRSECKEMPELKTKATEPCVLYSFETGE